MEPCATSPAFYRTPTDVLQDPNQFWTGPQPPFLQDPGQFPPTTPTNLLQDPNRFSTGPQPILHRTPATFLRLHTGDNNDNFAHFLSPYSPLIGITAVSPIFADAPSYWPKSRHHLLQMSPPGSKNDPQTPPWDTLGPKNGPKCPKTCPQGAPASHKVRPGGPKGAQRCPKEAQRAPKRDPKASPKAPQKAPKNATRTLKPYFLKTELPPARGAYFAKTGRSRKVPRKGAQNEVQNELQNEPKIDFEF